MKLYMNPRSPSPRRLRIFLAEKGIQVPTEDIDLGQMQHRTAAFAAINPLQRIPALVLDDGTVLTESIAICRYFEGLQPEPPLFGVGALEQAIVEMWDRRLELHLYQPVSMVFRHLHPAMAVLENPQVAAWGEVNKPRVMECLGLLDEQLADHSYVACDRFSVADITALVSVDFMKPAKLTVPEGLVHLRRWHAAVSARPSAAA